MRALPPLLAGVLSTLSLSIGAAAQSAVPERRVPGETWMRYADLASAGWSTEKLAEAEEAWRSLDSAAWMVVEDGVVVVAWGDVQRRYMCHSVRKSFMSGLYGLAVDAGAVDTQKTMADLGIDDEPPLTDVEKTARIEDLLRARSGVYKLAAYEPPQNPKPPRGSFAPGTNWCYNNWDFNTLCTIYEQETGLRVFEQFGARFAAPLGMQDYRVRDGYYHYELDKSIHPAYPFRLSARDSARYGLLYLSAGLWGDERVLSEEWVERSTRSYSDTGSGGYGYMWWIQGDERVAGTGMYSAEGVGGQMIAVLPEAGLVIVNRTDTYLGQSVPQPDRIRLVDLILQARTGERAEDVALVPLESDPPLAGADVDRERLASLAGAYRSSVRGADCELRMDGDVLVFEHPGSGSFGLTPLEERLFFVEDVETRLLVEEAAGDGPGSIVWEWELLRMFGSQLDADALDDATVTAERMLELFPGSALSYAALAMAMARSGDPGIARELCREALEIDPDLELVLDLAEELSQR